MPLLSQKKKKPTTDYLGLDLSSLENKEIVITVAIQDKRIMTA